MRILFLLSLFFVFFCVGGCAPYAIVNGRKIEVLTDAEEKKLLEYARTIALNSPALKLTLSQLDFVRRNPPQVQLFYFSDRAGRATYDWVFDPKRTLRLSFGGRFLTDEVLFRVQVLDHSAASLGEDKNIRLLNNSMETEETVR